MLVNVQSFADVASVNVVNAVLSVISTSNAAAPVKLTVVRAGAALAVMSPAVPVTVNVVNLV